ncbi:MAG: Hpt domain-containing protein [Bacteroidota bacterium]
MKLDTLLNYSSGDLNFVKETIDLFIEESDSSLTNIARACSSGDWKTVNRLSHSLKSNYATFELENLRALAYEIEKASENYTGSGKEIKNKIVQLTNKTKPVYPMLRQELKRLM